jgi:molybdopterin molybdotransferase
LAELLNVDRALAQILEQIAPLSVEPVALDVALDRVLAEDVVAASNLPPFANSSMDGYALRSDDVRDAPVTLTVTMDIPAGHAPSGTLASGEAARIMTGAPMPEGADAVIPVEETDGGWDRGASTPPPAYVRVFRAVEAGAYVRPVGEDVTVGTRVLRQGTRIRPQEMGVLAALGQAQVPVYRQPRVVILSSGDELVSVEEPLIPGKIRDVNRYTLAGLVRHLGGIPLVLPPARDTAESVRATFAAALAEQPDMVMSSAGVSVGAADLVRDILDDLGRVDFWRINLRPGKPLAFGRLGNVPFFGLPGNPVSVMITYDVLVRPALLKQMGLEADWPLVTARVGERMISDGRRSYVRVKLHRTPDNGWVAVSTGTQSSGALMSMVLADGLLIVPEGMTEVAEGAMLPVRLLRNL